MPPAEPLTAEEPHEPDCMCFRCHNRRVAANQPLPARDDMTDEEWLTELEGGEVAKYTTFARFFRIIRDRDAALRQAGEERDRLRAGLEKVQERHSLAETGYGRHPTEAAKHWHDGLITALATCSLIAREHLDPVAWAEYEAQSETAAHGSDQEWFDQTGNCGHCGNVAAYCCCTPDDPCGCGPHELSTEPLQCSWCKGSGIAIRPRGSALREGP